MTLDSFTIKKELNFALSCIQKNNHLDAIRIYEKILKENENNSEANSNLGMLYAQNNNLDKAEKHLIKAVKVDVNNPYLLNNLASILTRLGRNNESITHSKNAIRIKKNFSLAYNNLGLAQKNIYDNENAKLSFLKAIETDIKNVLPYYNIACLYESLNDLKNSETYYLKAIEVNSKYFSPYNNIMNLYERTNNDSSLKHIIERGEKEFPNNSSIKLFKGKLQYKSKLYSEAINNLESLKFDKNNYAKESIRCNVLANCYDAVDKFDKAFVYFKLANKINFELNKNKVSIERSTKVVEDRINFFQKENLKNWEYNSDEKITKDPVFIIGFPRSGTTLLDAILNSHPDIEVIEEKPIINKFVKLLHKEINSEFSNLKHIDQQLIKKMKTFYFDVLKNYSKQNNQKIYIDKMPLNIIYVGEIVRIFPNAKFVLAIRHPSDCILSCFMQNFLLNDSMANFVDLDSTSKFYNQVMTLWEQYQSLFKINYHFIKYEDLVRDFENNISKLLNFLDLEWSDEVNKFHEKVKNRGKISTPSYNQVNKKIYSKSIGRWKNYEIEFQKVLPLIQPWIKNFDY